MLPATATETLEAARTARARGDVGDTLCLAALAMEKAREERAPDVGFLAACAPARLYASRGEPHEARGWYSQAREIAMDFGLTRRLPEVYHDLFVVSRDAEEDGEARRYFGASATLYLDSFGGHPRLTALYADAAEAKFMRQPSPATAADSLLQWRSFYAANASPADRFLAGCSIMVAAAWLGIHSRYMDGIRLMEGAFPCLPDHLGVSLALSHAAGGALKAMDYTRAATLAQEALRVAVARGEGTAEARAREVLSAALAERQTVSCI